MYLIRNLKQYFKNKYFDFIGLNPKIKAKALFQDSEWHAWGVDLAIFEENPKIICAGLSSNITFELKLLEKINCTILALDPTPATASYIRNETRDYSNRFIFLESALSVDDGDKPFYVHKNDAGEIDYLYSSPSAEKELSKHIVMTRSVISLMKEMNWDYLDLLKIDIEGEEYNIIPSLIQNKVNIKQIAVEYHHRFFKTGISKTLEIHKLLISSGYELALRTPWCEEFLYIKNRSY